MAITAKEINSLYLALFNRVPEGRGQKHWLEKATKEELTKFQVAQAMVDSDASKEYFTGKSGNVEFVTHIYENLLNKGLKEDAEGINGWARLLDNGYTKGQVVSLILEAAENGVFTDAAAQKAQNLYLNKLKVAQWVAEIIDDVPNGANIKAKIAPFVNIAKGITENVSVMEALYNAYAEISKTGEMKTIAYGAQELAIKMFEGINVNDLRAVLVHSETGGVAPKPSNWNEIVARSPKLKDVGFNKDTGVTKPNYPKQLERADSNEDGLIKVKDGVYAKLSEYSKVYKDQFGKLYSDEKGANEINSSNVKLDYVEFANNARHWFTQPTAKNLSELDSSKLAATAKDGEMLTIGMTGMIYDGKGSIKDFIGTIAQVAAVNLAKEYKGVPLANDAKLRVFDTAGNINAQINALDSIKDKLTSVDAYSAANPINLNVEKYKAWLGKFTSEADENGTAAKYPMFMNALAIKEKIVIKDTASNIKSLGSEALDKLYGIDVEGQEALNLTQTQFTKLSSKLVDANDTIKITSVNGAISASKAKDIFTINPNRSDFEINNFSKDDKVDFTKFGLNSKMELTNTANKRIDDKGLYFVKYNGDISNKNFDGNDFTELFSSGPNNKALSTNGSNLKAVVAVKGNDVTSFYEINADGDGTIAPNELTMLGSVLNAADFSSNNLLIA